MSATPREIGTLVVVILKAQHLPNKRHIGKQDPYCSVTLSGEKRRTRAIKRGGQHPEWDEEVRFTLFEDNEDTLSTSTTPAPGSTPPPLPPKSERRKKKIKGGNSMVVACYADDPKEPELIGETIVDLTEVLTKGETDEWFTLQNKDKFSGEVYLELTFWSNEKPPEKKTKTRPVKPNIKYGGPGSFVPSESDSSFGSTDSRSSVTSSLHSASSLAKLDLYNPPYETVAGRIAHPQATGSVTVNQLTDEFGGLSVRNGQGVPSRRRESFPPPRNGHTPKPTDQPYSTFSTSSSYQSNEYGSEGYSMNGSSFSYENPATPLARTQHRHSFGEPGQSYPAYQSPYDPNPGGYPSHQQEYSSSMYSIPSASSGFAPANTTPTPSGFAPIPTGTPASSSGFSIMTSSTPAPSGFIHPIQTGYVTHPAQTSVPYACGPQPSQTPAPSGFLPPSSSMGYHQPPAVPQNYTPYQQYPPQPPQMMYQSSPSSSTLTSPPHSVPPQQYATAPSPSHSGIISQQYPMYAPSTPSPPQPQPPPQQYNPSPPIQGSRPLPTPGGQNGGYPATPPHAMVQTPPQGPSPTHPNSIMYTNPNPSHIPPQPTAQQSHPLPVPPGPPSQPPITAGPPPVMQQNGFIPPPPPPPLRRVSGPPPPVIFHQQHGSGEQMNGQGQSPGRPPLPQPPVSYKPGGGTMPLPPPTMIQQPGSGFQPPPPPPALPNRRIVSTSQPPLQLNSQTNGSIVPRSVKPGEIYNPGPPPRPPVVYDSTTGFWNTSSA